MQKHKFSGIEYSRPQQLPCQISLTDWCTCDHQCNRFAQLWKYFEKYNILIEIEVPERSEREWTRASKRYPCGAESKYIWLLATKISKKYQLESTQIESSWLIDAACSRRNRTQMSMLAIITNKQHSYHIFKETIFKNILTQMSMLALQIKCKLANINSTALNETASLYL